MTSAHICTISIGATALDAGGCKMERANQIREKLRKAIIAKIKREGWSQSEAGRLCGTSRVHMNHLVNGMGSAALNKLIQVAEDLGLRVELLIEDKGK